MTVSSDTFRSAFPPPLWGRDRVGGKRGRCRKEGCYPVAARNGAQCAPYQTWPLTWALLAALALHALAILGHSVTVPPVPDGGLAPRLMDITLVVPVRTTREPEATALPGPVPAEPSAAPEPPVEPAPPAPEPVTTVAEPPPTPAPTLARPATPAPAAQKPPPPKPAVPSSSPAKPDAKLPTVQKALPEKPSALPPLSAAELMSRGLQMARSATGLQDQTYGAREKLIDPTALTTDEDFYLQAWMRKVEQVGSLNFPDAARRLRQPGGPTLDVAVRADGSVKSILTVRSSGDQALDDAARRIVSLAAPFAPFPEALRRDYDVLHIVRRWKFDRGQLYGQ